MENTIQLPAIDSLVKVTTKHRNINYFTSEAEPFQFFVTEGVVIANSKFADANSISIKTGNPDFPVSEISIRFIVGIEIINGTTANSTKFYNVKSSRGGNYVVSEREGHYSCTCTGFKYHGKCRHIGLLTKDQKSEIIDVSTKEIPMKQVYTISHDNDFLQRKLDHYNKWLLDPKRDFGSTYPGFPEEVDRAAKLAKGRAIMEAERVAKVEAKAKKVAAPKAKRVVARKSGPTKIDRAIELYKANMKLSKDNMIDLLRTELEMSLAGATTYYYNAKKAA